MSINDNLFRSLIVAMVVMTVVAPMASMGVLAAQTGNGDDINPAADPAQNPHIETDVTKEKHDMDEFGTGDSGLLTYYDNDGDATALPASVNDSMENPVSYTPTHIDVDEYGAFPHGEEDVSGLNASYWTTDEAGTAGSISVDDTTVQPNVEAVQVATSGQSSGDSATATFDNFSITSDEDKRMLIVGADVNTLDSGAHVEVRAVDEDGDYKAIEANTSADTAADATWTDSAGDSRIAQVRLGELDTEGSGDGNFDNIEEIEVVVQDGDFDGELSILNADSMSQYDFGDQRVDTDDDGEMDDTETLREPEGEVSVTGLDTLGSAFDSATIHGVTYEATFEAAHLDADDAAANFTSAEDYQSYDRLGDTYYRLTLEDTYDLSYANAELKDEVSLPETRYRTVEYAEGTGDTDMENVSDWTETTDSYDEKGKSVTLDSTIQPGQDIVFHSNALYTDAEMDAIFSDGEGEEAESGGGGGMFGGGGGGILDAIISPIGGAISAVLAFLGIKRRSG